MRTVQEIYEKYRLMSGLQEHQLRVGAVGKLLADSIPNVNGKDVVLTCLFHDMGNIIKSHLDVFPEFLQPQGLEYWKSVKEDFVRTYGSDEHEATKIIATELSLSQDVIHMIDTIAFSNIPRILEKEPIEMHICEYADMRVGPHGIISLKDRLEDLKKRYSPRWREGAHKDMEKSFNASAVLLEQLEQQLFEQSSLHLEDINDATAAPVIEELRRLEI